MTYIRRPFIVLLIFGCAIIALAILVVPVVPKQELIELRMAGAKRAIMRYSIRNGQLPRSMAQANRWLAKMHMAGANTGVAMENRGSGIVRLETGGFFATFRAYIVGSGGNREWSRRSAPWVVKPRRAAHSPASQGWW